MGFFARLFGSPSSAPSPEPSGFLKGPGTFQLPIVGESHYQDELEAICGGRTEEGEDLLTEALLVLEDSNPYGPEAVRVDIDGRTVGHLSRENACEYRRRLVEAGHPRLRARCRARIRGGWDRGADDRGHFGVWIDLPTGD